MEEDGTSSMVVINQPYLDEQTGQNVTLNDLSQGDYDVVCDFGPAFNSQQKETTQAFLDMAAIDPTFLEQGKDIMLKNLSVPGMDQMAERARTQMLEAGMIPESQWTDEERQQIEQMQAEQANQEPVEDPMMVAARAEEGKAQAAQMEAQNKQQQVQVDAQIKMAGVQVDQERINLEREKLQLDAQKFMKGQDDKFNLAAAQIDQGQQKIDQDTQKMMNDMALKLTDLEMKFQQQLDAQFKANAETTDTTEDKAP
jgi:hypothetical protein